MENSKWAETLYEDAMKQVGKGTHNVTLLTHLLCCQICNSDFCALLQRVMITLAQTNKTENSLETDLVIHGNSDHTK